MEETKCLLTKLAVCKAESLPMELGRKNKKAKRLIGGVAGNELTFQQNTFGLSKFQERDIKAIRY